MRRALSRIALWFVVVLAIDQGSKLLVQTVAPELVQLNKAVAFSVRLPVWVVLLAAVLLGLLLLLEWRSWSHVERPRRAWAVGVLLGGAASNLLDRAMVGAVRDFIATGVWPVFNLADVALTVGAVGLLWYAVKSSLTTSHGRQGASRADRT